MHSSRMHTAHFSTISSSILGEGLHLGEEVCPPPMDADPLWMQQMQTPWMQTPQMQTP